MLTSLSSREEPDAQLADQVQREIDVWHAYAEFYSDEFVMMRARPQELAPSQSVT